MGKYIYMENETTWYLLQSRFFEDTLTAVGSGSSFPFSISVSSLGTTSIVRKDFPADSKWGLTKERFGWNPKQDVKKY